MVKFSLQMNDAIVYLELVQDHCAQTSCSSLCVIAVLLSIQKKCIKGKMHKGLIQTE